MKDEASDEALAESVSQPGEAPGRVGLQPTLCAERLAGRVVNVYAMAITNEPVLGRIMRDARRQAGVSQAQLAVRTGIAAPSISRIENGHESPSFERFASCMDALGFSPTVELRELGGSEADPIHLAAEAQMTPSQRLASLFEWMRFGDRLAGAQLRPLPKRGSDA